MPKKRLVFTLLYQNGGFYLSRNYRLQRVGDLKWLKKNYQFETFAKAIDELVIINVSRDNKNIPDFCSAASEVSSNCFMPLVLGGRIRTLDDAELLIRNGADKLLLGTALSEDPILIQELVSIYGSQCIMASVDYRVEKDSYKVYSQDGRKCITLSFKEYIRRLADLRIGEVYLNSIDQDGTGQGYNLDSVSQLSNCSHIPIIMAGGAGNKHHLLEGLQTKGVDAVATANLFNFIGDGLNNARLHLIEQGMNMSSW